MANNKVNMTKSLNMMENSMEKMWDMWLVGLGSISWAQEQIENMTRKQLDQNKAAREEMMKFVEELARQTRRNQEQFQQMVEEAVVSAYDQVNGANQQIIKDMTKKAE